MDEYLFLTLAKLKADRKKLEQEEREKARAEGRDLQQAPAKRDPPNLPQFVPFLSWR